MQRITREAGANLPRHRRTRRARLARKQERRAVAQAMASAQREGDMYKVDYSRNEEHERAVRIAQKQLRPFTRFYVIGKPVTYNADFLPNA